MQSKDALDTICWKQYWQLWSDFQHSEFKKKIKVFLKYFVLISSTVCVENRTIVAYIVFSKSYLRNLLMAFIFFLIRTFVFKIVDFAHFFVDLQPIKPKFKKVLPIQCSPTLELVTFRKWRFWHFQRKSLISKRRKNTHFRHIRPNCGALRQKSTKIEPSHWIWDTFRECHKIVISSNPRILV